MKLRDFCAMTSLVFFLIPSVTFADTSTPTAPSNFLGVGLGANFSGFSTENPGVNNNNEFTANIFIDWNLGNIWYLQTGLRYTSYGLSGTAAYSDFFQSDEVHFLEIPVLIKPTFDAGGWFPYFIAGPNLGIKLGENLSSGSGNLCQTINFSANFGAGAEIPVSTAIRAYLQFDYALGLINIFDYGGLGASHTRGTNVTAGAMMAF